MLKERGITSVADLTRLVPGLTIQESSFNSTSFTLRGVGFFNSDLATPPAVTVYVDEAPLPYPAMTRLAAFDLARVEVLKGPQGTLYGQNATGGAVNYIAAKPTEAFEAGVDATYGSFDRTAGWAASSAARSLITLGVRVAVQGRRGDAWQESITRPGDELGKIRELQASRDARMAPRRAVRVPRSRLPMTHDDSDSIAAQFLAPAPTIPPLAVPGLLTFPVVTEPRAADWTPDAVRHRHPVSLRQRHDARPSELAQRLPVPGRLDAHFADVIRPLPHGLWAGQRRNSVPHQRSHRQQRQASRLSSKRSASRGGSGRSTGSPGRTTRTMT